MSDAKTNWVDFREVKAAVTMRMVLDRYQINWLRKNKVLGKIQKWIVKSNKWTF